MCLVIVKAWKDLVVLGNLEILILVYFEVLGR